MSVQGHFKIIHDYLFRIKYQLEKLLDRRGWQRCLRQACTSVFGHMWPWPLTLSPLNALVQTYTHFKLV